MAGLLHSENNYMTKEELDNLSDNLTDSFRKSFSDCLEQINNQKNTVVHGSELTQLRTKRGVENEFILPIPGYVIKTGSNGDNILVNICFGELVASAKLKFAEKCENVCASYITYFLSHPKRQIIDCYDSHVVYDVVFHRTISDIPDFKQFINNITLSNIERIFNISLDRDYVELSGVRYVGTPERITTENYIRGNVYYPENLNAGLKIEENGNLFGKILIANETRNGTGKCCDKHECGVYLQKLKNKSSDIMHNPLSVYSAVNIHLPLLPIFNMDFGEKIISSLSQMPLQYHLNVILPYPLKDNCSETIIDRVSVRNIITIPFRAESFQIILNSMSLLHEDSGIDSDIGSPETHPTNLKTDLDHKPMNGFFDPSSSYIFPSFNISALKNIITLTLNIKNAVTDSLQYVQIKNCLALKCFSPSATMGPLHYAFLLKLDSDISNIQVEIWDNNITFQFTMNFDVTALNGKQEILCDNMEVSQDECSDNSSEFISNNKTGTSTAFSDAINCPDLMKTTSRKEKTVRGIIESNKIRSISESSEDNPSLLKRRGILKFGSISRSVSESSVDEHYGFSISFDHDVNGSVEMASTSLDPCKDSDIACKKTVRFKEVVSKQVFRSNSSILGQKKKNQRKNRNKKRAHDRKLSESENSEGEDKDASTENVIDKAINKEPVEISNTLQELKLNNKNTNCSAFRNDLIFQIDM